MLAYTLRKDKKRKDAESADKMAVQPEGEAEDKVAKNQGDAFIEVFKKLRPGEPVTLEGARKFFENMIFDPKRYDLSSVGRMKLNIKLGFKPEFNQDIFTLTLEDMVQIVRYFLKLKYDRTGSMRVDDIDHLANRRIRAVGELVENAFRIGLMRLEKIIRERITNSPDITRGAAARAAQHQAGVRRPQGVLRHVAAVAVHGPDQRPGRDHPQAPHLGAGPRRPEPRARRLRGARRPLLALRPHLPHRDPGRPEHRPDLLADHLCPRQRLRLHRDALPQGGERPGGRLLTASSTPATPSSPTTTSSARARPRARSTRLQKAGKKTPLFSYHPFYLTAWEEEEYTIAQANTELDDKGRLVAKKVDARKAGGETLQVDPMEVNFMDISPKQIVSISAALIPFLENDDANRALMGSNMQRQAVPLINPEAAIVATGMEHRLIKDSGMVVVCRRSGVVMNADAERIIVKVDADNADENNFSEVQADLYELQKFRRSNQNTIINQRPLVKVGERVERGQILCDGPASDKGELAMGRNILAAFVPWRGYNYEDAIILSERLVKTSAFNSIYIVEETIEARETKLGPEEITRDIPSVSETALKNLDESGIVRIGAKVKPGEILVGKVSPEGGNAAVSRGKAPARHFRRAGLGDQGLLPLLPAGRGGHGDRRQGLHPPRPEQGQARPGDRPHRDRQDGAQLRRREEDPARREVPEDRPAAAQGKAGQDPQLQQEEIREGQAHPGQGTGGDGRRLPEGNEEAHRRGQQGPDQRSGEEGPPARRRPQAGDPGKDRPDEEGRRVRPGHHQDRQGADRRQPQDLGGRQDGRPPRQQGRGRPHPARRGHAVPGRRPPRRRGAQPAGRSVAHERRPGVRDDPGLGRQGAGLLFRDAGLRRRHRARRH